MINQSLLPPSNPDTQEHERGITRLAPEEQYKIIIHNDDVTPYEYVILVLEHIFSLSSEIAEHVTWTAHNEGQAVVLIRPRPEADRLVTVAHGRARADGYPLSFTLEPA